MEAEYNDIARWNYTAMPAAFGAKEGDYGKYVVKTKEELERLLTDKEFNDSNKLQFVELWMPKEDAPRALRITAKISAETNARTQ